MLVKSTGGNQNFRYVTAVMIEARIRGYPLLDICASDMPPIGNFIPFFNDIVDWLIRNYPQEFCGENITSSAP